MQFQRKEVKTGLPRTKYTLVGRLVASNDRSICIQRHGVNKTRFWMTYDKDKFIPKAGDLVECDINISSYIAKEQPLFRWSLYYKGFRALPELGDSIATFFSNSDGIYDIVDVLQTEIPSVYMIKAKNISTNEIINARYHSSEGKPALGRSKINLDISSLSSVIGTDGLTYENKYIREYTNKEGKVMTKEFNTFFTTLIATSIWSLESHGEGGYTKGI